MELGDDPGLPVPVVELDAWSVAVNETVSGAETVVGEAVRELVDVWSVTVKTRDLLVPLVFCTETL